MSGDAKPGRSTQRQHPASPDAERASSHKTDWRLLPDKDNQENRETETHKTCIFHVKHTEEEHTPTEEEHPAIATQYEATDTNT